MFQNPWQTRLFNVWLCVFVWAPFGLFAQNRIIQDSVILCGTITNADSASNLTFRFYKDFLSFEEITFSPLIENDSFYLKIPFFGPTPGFIGLEPVNVPIFLQKGDSLHLKASAKDFTNTLTYQGIGALANEYLKASFLQFDTQDAQKISEGIIHNTAAGFQDFLLAYKSEKISFLETFLAQRDTQFSTVFTEYVKADINYWWGQNLMKYRVQHPASAILPVSLSLSEEYFAFMDTLALNNEAALNNINYLNYLDQYLDWRADRIARGKLKFKNVSATQKKLIMVKMVETFAQILIDQLGVRKEAYDPLSTFANLERGKEVLYLQDITNDRFMYPYKGRRYLDKFLKIELPDGRWGWVFKGGVNLKQKIVYAKKWVEIPDTRPELMQNFKYANFKGKVMHYAIAKDLYRQVVKGTKDQQLLKDYLDKAEENPYKEILAKAYQAIVNNPTPAEPIDTQAIATNLVTTVKDSILQKNNILKAITSTTAKNLLIKSRNNAVGSGNKYSSGIEIVTPPDFSKFTRNTALRFELPTHLRESPQLTVNTNPLFREATDFPIIKNKQKARLDIPLNTTTTATLKLGDESLDLYIQPGYDLQVQVAGNNLWKNVSFSGKGSKINNFLLALGSAFKDADAQVEQHVKSADPSTFKAFLDNLKQQKLKFLRTYLQSHQMSVEVLRYAKADIEYWHAFNMMNYPFEHPIYHNQPTPMAVPDDYYDFMDDLDVNNEGAIPSKYYTYYLQDFLSFNSNKPDNKGLNRLELADKYLRGKPLYFYKALQTANEIKRNNNLDAERVALDLLNNCPYEVYKEYVKYVYHEQKGIVEGMAAPAFEITDKDGNIVRLSDYEGKVVFIDFWATWCGPCKRLEPMHKKLQEQFKGDNVVFLYVSMDKNANSWRSYLQRNPLPGTHLFANEAMVQNYKVDTLPYSLLIDTKGKIVRQHTGGFSIQKTAQQILALLQ